MELGCKRRSEYVKVVLPLSRCSTGLRALFRDDQVVMQPTMVTLHSLPSLPSLLLLLLLLLSLASSALSKLSLFFLITSDLNRHFGATSTPRYLSFIFIARRIRQSHTFQLSSYARRFSSNFANSRSICNFFFFFTHFYFPASGQSRGHRCRPFPPPGSCLQLLSRIGSAVPLTARRFFHRVLLTHALALSASQFVHKEKSLRIYSTTSWAGQETHNPSVGHIF